jgi:hypothetical protein
MLSEGSAYLSRAKIRSYLKGLFGEDEPDIAVETVIREITRRQRLCGAGYPFGEESLGIKYTKGSEGTAYAFMLCISASKPYRAESRYKETDELFDSLVLDAIKGYLGNRSSALRFGSPASGARPRNFKDAIVWLARQLTLPSGKGRALSAAGDGGLDVVAWRPFRDSRPGYLVLLCQCTVQRDWFPKGRDLLEDVWRGWIDFGKHPHLVLAIPFAIPSAFAKWDELRRIVHTALDRLRLCELVEGIRLSRESEIQKWVAKEIQRLAP